MARVVRDADRTKKKILDAAIGEFSALGIAGARVDRIAEAAGCNKAMIYAYYGNKDQLFDAVYTHHVALAFDGVVFDPRDLAGYASQLFDCYQRNPELQRLSTWYALERPDGSPLKARTAATRVKLEGIARAQQEGRVTTRYTPDEVLALVRAISSIWPPLPTADASEEAIAERERRRALVIESAKRLFTPDDAAVD